MNENNNIPGEVKSEEIIDAVVEHTSEATETTEAMEESVTQSEVVENIPQEESVAASDLKQESYLYETPVQNQSEGAYSQSAYGQTTYQSTGQNYTYDTNTAYHPNNIEKKPQDTNPMTLGDWIFTMLAACLPCVGIFIYIYWAVSKETNVNRQNFCRAWLIFAGVSLVVCMILFTIFGVAMVSLVSTSAYY